MTGVRPIEIFIQYGLCEQAHTPYLYEYLCMALHFYMFPTTLSFKIAAHSLTQ